MEAQGKVRRRAPILPKCSTDSRELVAIRIGFLNGTWIHPLPVNP